MADAGLADGFAAPAPVGASKSGRALGLTGAFLACLLAAGALAITVLGGPRPATITLDLPPPPPLAPAAAPAPVSPALPDVATGPVTKPIYAGRALIADPALVENTDIGPLPRIADDGRKPMQAYAAPAAPGKFRIAIVVSGLGISAKASQAAIDTLPSSVTLGFAPYAGDVARFAAAARARGHETLLEIPMEPFDFPDSDPGPHTLRAGADGDTNAQRLAWSLSRFTGYAGVTNLLGERLLGDSDALSPLMTELARRGLYFYDNGAAAQSSAPQVASQAGTAFAQGTLSIDTIQTALEIDAKLSALETQARDHGSAVGSAFLYPVSVERIALWAKTLSARGFVLVPVSAIVSEKK